MAKMSKLLAVDWQTGPSGRVTPVATIAPVEIGGATVQSVGLHNVSNVERLSPAIGDEVLVSRRNDVIPYLEEVVVRHGGEVVTVPSQCATCKAELSRRGEYLVCTNLSCRALIEGRILRWVGTQNILEWGDKLVAQLVEAKLVAEPADLYKLTIEQIAGLERRGTIIAKKVLDNLKSKLPLPLPVFLASLGIDDFAHETAKLLVAKGYDTLEKLQAATVEEIAEIKGMGAIKAKSVVHGLKARAGEIQRLLAAGVVPVAPSAGGSLSGKTFCFTGTLPRPRKEYEQLVEKYGGTVLSGVTKDLNYLVLSDPNSASTKAEKARKYGTQCIDADAFMALLPAE
jgi:DNA ligase (NAD+)